MGQEITFSHFTKLDFERFHTHLLHETALLDKQIASKACSDLDPVAGLEIEAWLIDQAMQAAPINKTYLETLNDPMAFPELAKFNIELNSPPLPLTGNVLSQMHQNLQATWNHASQHAQSLNTWLLMIGILPTLKQSDLTLGNMSNMNRYRALNEQILHSRGKPIHLDINGIERLKFDHHDVMLESATTSLQIHTQLSLQCAHHYYNASIIASAPMVALCANAPFLFGKELWHETRIPLFEQAIETGGYDGAAQGPLHRVSFGSGYARHSIIECFIENLEHFPVLLPENFDLPLEHFDHLRLHNGTIWRWNRPLIGFDADGTVHIRVEHRTPAAGPTIVDSIANVAFYYGLTKYLCDQIMTSGEIPLPFAQAKDNFYQAARYGLEGNIIWFDGVKQRTQKLLLTELLPKARTGLQSLGINPGDIDTYLDIIAQRIVNKQNGCRWQQQFVHTRQADMNIMTQHYLKHQHAGKPICEWEL